MQTFYLSIISALILYIVFLHTRLVRKNVFIESTVKKISGVEEKWKMEELVKFLEEIKKLSLYSSFFNDKLFEDKNLKYILENSNDSKIYIHYTRDEADAMSIVNNGFRFADSFYKTALPVSHDKLDLIIKHNSRKYFGDYMLVICISGKIINGYSTELEGAGISNFFIEHILTETPPVKNENSDLVFTLPKQYIKGYINTRSGKITGNIDFNPEYTAIGFRENIDRLKGKSVQ